MSAEGSTEGTLSGLTQLEMEAARGELPAWARASPSRREHMARVAALLEAWAHGLGLGEEEALRWAATGWLHDILRDADPGELVRGVATRDRDLPAPVLHGPAAAERLRGLVSDSVSTAIRFHTIGHPTLDDMGRALFLADFLEPGRTFAEEWRAALRARMPAERERVLVEVLAARISHLVDVRKPIRPETAAFWSAAVTGGLR